MRSLPNFLPIVALLVAAAAAPLSAQEEKAKPADPAMEELAALQKEFRGALRDAAVNEDAGAARAAAAKPFLPRFQALATKHAGTAAGLRAVNWVLDLHRMTDDAAGWQAAFDAALRDYANDPAFASIVRGVHGPDAEKTLRRVIEASSNVEVKANAHLRIAEILWQDGKAKGEELAAARAAFAKVVQDFAGTEVATEAKGNLQDIDHLQVGMKAPEIAFTDLQGTARKLSDFKGKVVLLNFWAPW